MCSASGCGKELEKTPLGEAENGNASHASGASTCPRRTGRGELHILGVGALRLPAGIGGRALRPGQLHRGGPAPLHLSARVHLWLGAELAGCAGIVFCPPTPLHKEFLERGEAFARRPHLHGRCARHQHLRLARHPPSVWSRFCAPASRDQAIGSAAWQVKTSAGDQMVALHSTACEPNGLMLASPAPSLWSS